MMGRRICLILMVLACVVLCSLGRSDDTPAKAAPPFSLQDIWLYVPMDDTLTPAVNDHVYRIYYRQWSVQALLPDTGAKPTFTTGLVGKSVFIGGPGNGRNGDAISYLLDIRTFPKGKGSILFWYKPTRPAAKEASWLFGMGWCVFQANQSNGMFTAYATSDSQGFAKGSMLMASPKWEDTWHLITVTWDGRVVLGYVDGQVVAERRDVKPMADVIYMPYTFDLGSLPPGGARKTPVLYAEAAYDDLAILSKALSADEINSVYKYGSAAGYPGLLSLVGPSARVVPRRTSCLQGEKLTIDVQPVGSADAAKLVVLADGKSLLEKEIPAGKPSPFILDTGQFRPGRYTLRVDMFQQKTLVGSSAETPLTIRAFRQPEFPVGLGATFNLDERTLDCYEKMHISHISCNGPQGDYFFRDQLDRAFAHGICLFPNFNILEVWGNDYASLKREPYFQSVDGGMRVSSEWAWKYLQTLVYADGSADTHATTSSASPFSPIAWDMMTARIRQIMDAAGDHPGLWAVSFQDEVPLRMTTEKETGKLKVGDYSYYAVEQFKKATGLKEAAFPPTDPEGTVWPENHPYLQWMRQIGLPGNDFTSPAFENLYARLGKEVKKYRPDILVTNYSGGEYGANDSVLDWNYPVIWGPQPWGYASGAPYLDFVFDRHWARQNARPRKPLWALLGWWSENMEGQPDWCVPDFRLNTEFALAKGVKQLMWFSIGNGPFAAEGKSGPFSRPDLRAEMESWCNFLYEKGPVFARLEKRPSHKTAVLWSETNRAGYVVKTADKAEYHLVFSGLRNIGANPDLITDTMIHEGALDGYEALVLCGFNYSSTELWKRINAFAAKPGKTVFYDAASKLIPPNAVPLGAKWTDTFADRSDKRHSALISTEAVGKWANLLRPLVLPKLSRPDLEILDDPSGQVGAHLLWAGNTPYLFVINTDMLQERTATVRLRHAGTVAYDLVSGQALHPATADGRVTFNCRLQPGGWAAYMLPPAEVADIRVNAGWAAGKLTISTQVVDRANKRVAAVFPLRIEVIDPTGKVTPYDRYTATDAYGIGQAVVTLGKLADPAGNWSVRVTEGLTKKVGVGKTQVGW